MLQLAGTVRDVAQQPDGRLVAVGNFSEVNEQAADNIVRFQLTGAVDTAFCRRARCTGGEAVRVLALADSTLYVGGTFKTVGNAPRAGVVRLQASGQPSGAFTSALAAGTTLNELVRQADGKLLLAGSLQRPGIAAPARLLRLLADGRIDGTFQPLTAFQPNALLAQPDGTIIVGTTSASPQVVRLLASGAPDPSFTSPVLGPGAFSPGAVQALARQPDGRLLVGGRFTSVGAVRTVHVARLLPDGTPDATFSSQLLQSTGSVSSLAVQPNGRVLLTAVPQLPVPAAAPSLYRLLADGAPDGQFDSNQGPTQGAERVKVQADGAITVAGSFVSVGSLPAIGLVRLLDAHVLPTRASMQADAQLQAWPVPARDALHVRLAAGLVPRRVEVVNLLGQTLQTQAGQAAEFVLEVAGLAPGVYFLRVHCLNAPAMLRRIEIL